VAVAGQQSSRARWVLALTVTHPGRRYGEKLLTPRRRHPDYIPPPGIGRGRAHPGALFVAGIGAVRAAGCPPPMVMHRTGVVVRLGMMDDRIGGRRLRRGRIGWKGVGRAGHVEGDPGVVGAEVTTAEAVRLRREKHREAVPIGAPVAGPWNL